MDSIINFFKLSKLPTIRVTYIWALILLISYQFIYLSAYENNIFLKESVEKAGSELNLRQGLFSKYGDNKAAKFVINQSNVSEVFRREVAKFGLVLVVLEKQEEVESDSMFMIFNVKGGFSNILKFMCYMSVSNLGSVIKSWSLVPVDGLINLSGKLEIDNV